jgi:hypothetical protein
MHYIHFFVFLRIFSPLWNFMWFLKIKHRSLYITMGTIEAFLSTVKLPISWQEQVTFPWVNDDVHFVLHLWCSLCTMMSTFQPYHDENIGWNDDDISFVIDKNMLSWIFIELARWNNSPRVDMLLHSDPLLAHLTLVHSITGHNFETRHSSNDSDQIWFPLV